MTARTTAKAGAFAYAKRPKVLYVPRVMKPFTPAAREQRSDPARQLTLRILAELVGSQPLRQLRIRLWDGSFWPDDGTRPATLVLKHPGSLREMLLPGSELALAEAYLHDDFNVEGDVEAAFELGEILRNQTRGWSQKLKIGHLLQQLPNRASVGRLAQAPAASRPRGTAALQRPPAELSGRQHSLSRDRDAVRFHYDLSNEFYGLWLDSRLVYSCAYFRRWTDDLETAQRDKLDYICRKLDLKPGRRILDIGCGWGGLILHAASAYGAKAVGITLSERQAEYVRDRVRQLHLEGDAEVHLQDYRMLEGTESYDAIVSVGMVEHVGRKNLPTYFALAHQLLKPGGIFLNHGIGTGSVADARYRSSFIDRYVFPDGELFPIADTLDVAETAGFEIRDVENLREHYMLTLRHWVRRLETRETEAVTLVGEPVYRIWRLYMAGSAHAFNKGRLAVYQTLLAKLGPGGRAEYPLTRAKWYGELR
jgi:cyclopropane-fatty-acyl-phospholipid synthase